MFQVLANRLLPSKPPPPLRKQHDTSSSPCSMETREAASSVSVLNHHDTASAGVPIPIPVAASPLYLYGVSDDYHKMKQAFPNKRHRDTMML